MRPDVSVIIPTFNRLWALPQAIDSCRQPECSVEIIVVDDGSTDGTWDWLRAQKDVVALSQENWGKDWAVNRGFAAASGDYVRFLDSDDWLLPDANGKQLTIAREESADVVVAGYRVVNEISKQEHEFGWPRCDDFIAQQLGECDASHYSAYLFRKSFVEKIRHRQEFGPLDDRMFVVEAAMNKPSVAVYERPAFVHCHHERDRLQFGKGLQSAVTHWQHLNVYKKSLAMLDARGELTRRRRQAAAKVLWPLAHWIAYTHLDEACEVVRWIGELDETFVPPHNGALGVLYRRLGFRRTQQLLRVRRLGRSLFDA